MSADMSDSVKQKRPIQCPLFYRGFFISYVDFWGDDFRNNFVKKYKVNSASLR